MRHHRSCVSIFCLASLAWLSTVGCGDSSKGDGSASASASGASAGSADAKNGKPGSSTVPAKAEPEKPAGDTINASGPLKLELDGKAVSPSVAIISGIYGGKGLTLTVGTGQLSCSNYDVGPDNLTMELASGPNGDFYAGQVIPTEIRASFGDNLRGTANEPFAKLELGKIDASVDKVKVKIEFARTFEDINLKRDITIKGSGEIEAVLCKDSDLTKKALATAKLPAPEDKPVSGKVSASAPFEAKKAFAFVMHDDKMNLDYVSTIEFIDNPEATCDQMKVSMFEGGGADGQRVTLQPSISDKRQILGLYEPASISCPKQTGSSESWGTFGSISAPVAAVQLDAIDLKDGGSIKGRVVALTGPLDNKDDEASISGTFDAKICRRKW